MEINPRFSNHFMSLNFKCPYQAKVINVLDRISKMMVQSPRIKIFRFGSKIIFLSKKSSFMINFLFKYALSTVLIDCQRTSKIFDLRHFFLVFDQLYFRGYLTHLRPLFANYLAFFAYSY